MEKKQLKKIFNKNILKDKSFIKMVCFTIVLLLVLVLGNNFGYVSADGGFEYCLNLEDYQNSSIYDSTVDSSYINFYARNNISRDTYSNLGTIDFSVLSNNSVFDMSSIQYYAVQLGSSGNTIYFFDNLPRIFFYGTNGYQLQMPSDSHCYTAYMRYETNGTDLFNFSVSSDYVNELSLNYDSNRNVKWRQFDNIILSYANFPIYTVKQGWRSEYGDIYSAFNIGFCGDNGGGTNYFINMNYFSDSATPLIGFDNLVGVGNSSSGNLPENNMYAEYADWYLNNYSGNIPSNFRNMSVSFTSNLNDYINQQLANENGTTASDWVIYVDYSAFIDFYYKSVTDYGNIQISANLPENFANVSYTTPDIGSSTVYHWAASYEFPLYNNSDLGYNSAFDNVFHSPYNGYTTGFFMDGYKFANTANYVWTCPFSGLFAYMTPTSNSKFTNSNGVSYSIDITLYEIMQIIDANMINWSPEYEGLNQFKLTCDAQIMYVGDDSTVDYTSGWYSETFNLLTGESVTGSNAMLTNYNPYIDNTTDDYTNNLPSTSSGSSFTSVTTGNVTQTVTVSNEGAKYIPSIISSLIPSSFGDTSTGLANRFTTLVDSNNFITVMANTVPAIPTTVWTYLTEYLGISLYLLACAFVLRLILDLL